jgi:hypothetical protein
MVNAIVSATEAKTSALRELDVRSRFSGEVATGTVTDSIIIACTKNGLPIKYAGSGTLLGEMIGKNVKTALKKALFKQEKLVSNRLLTKRLKERGITIENLTTLFSQIRPLLRENEEKRKLFTSKLKEILSDANIASLIIAGIRLDEDAKNDLIPLDPKNKKHQNFLLHKLLQKATTDYMSKKEFKIKYVRPDFLSSTFSEDMGWFTRSVLSSIMYSTYSNIIQDQ